MAFIITAIAIIVVIVFLWVKWRILTNEYITGIEIGLTLLIPTIGWWVYKSRRKNKRKESQEISVFLVLTDNHQHNFNNILQRYDSST
jgi:carbon starvation protein CstA